MEAVIKPSDVQEATGYKRVFEDLIRLKFQESHQSSLQTHGLLFAMLCRGRTNRVINREV